MITNQELKSKIDYIHKACLTTNSLRERDKILSHLISITKSALHEQLLSYKPDDIIICTLKLFLYYNKTLNHDDNMCDWKRRRKRRLAKECYNNLLQVYIPEKSKEILQAVLNTIYENKLWEFETVCFEILCNLLESGVNGSLMFYTIFDKIEDPNMNIEDTRRIIRILYDLLDVYEWPDTYDTLMVIKRILNLFYISVTTTKSSVSFIKYSHAIPYAMIKKGLEVCIINMVKHVYNDHLLIIVQYMCSWAVEPGMTDEIILEYGSTLEYTAYMHEVTLYEKSLTPNIFPLLMEMIASKSKITSLLGNRVMQYLLDRRENKMNFDTPRIFFENTQFDLTIGECFKEDKMFCKLHREILHDSLLKSIVNHCTSRMNLETSYCTICLLAIEVPCGFTAAAIVCLIMNLQDLTLKEYKDQHEVSYHLHATIIAIMSLLCWVHKAKVFYEYVNKIMLERAQWAPHLNPPIQSQYNFAAHHILWDKPDLFFVDWEARYGLWKCFRLRETEDEATDI
ncbi:PREDICTED: uncharacterized protein LOC107189658 [Dufourea novaeangliae]|uniref:Protein EFR3 like protein B n=1 Tax=Dufourea novaeangliae TaxID=178035 RepID=A0A154PIC1_DUFNO|nr:PREDICTED: uncharacterized protein LOC107189658 [Dufourea novaeangliae]KZC11583.1 hypothetical protein WN55_02865 [Dufourea novaeangliae]